MEEWQSRRIIELAKECNVVDAGSNTRICPAILKEPIRGINMALLNHRHFRFYLHPAQYEVYRNHLFSIQKVCMPGDLPGDLLGEVTYHGVPFRRYEWMPLSTILVAEPDNLVVRPFTEETSGFAFFRAPNRVWVIINVLYKEDPEGADGRG